ncbi:cell envelope integrity protein CreD [Serratia sp. CY54039]|jgi:inner membrane protein|uniref:Cell envelope integrity protein CreD n=1 Tax=Serratia ureilytica TaxID=300181 RepID=A0ABU0VS47_9GAMM|nr:MULTISPECIES: cell envelope integrity protein CreD [Serratia]EMB2348430.1 cell envelope integrity protein CreD [Serratia marcescens]MBH1903726.1 cell envelope integrity protein CreD [Serratia ureilytica]MBH2989787.1 cell envelope integrity protein CreD [Serratia ureilytica]MBH3177324.1 cell envelope integrity protein CreD [Serratia ureilytica]MBH3268335.1 cell envelope integrity protein CreD [Serratia ureilytica]
MMKSVLFWKITTLLGLMVVMLIPIAQLMSVIDERSGYRQSVVGQVSESTSGAQRVLGPLIVIPYVEREEKKDEKGQTVVQRVQHYRYLLPESLQVQGAPKVEVRKLGIYQTQVYQGPLSFKVRFGQPELTDLQRANVTVGQPFLLVALSDSRGIKSISPLVMPQPVAFEPGTGVGALRQGIHAPLTLAMLQQKEGLNADFTLTLAGTSSLSLVPLGRSSELQLQSNWPHPNFLGNFLPDERKVTEQGFSARWRSTWFANNINSAFYYDDGIIDEDKLPAFSASLVEPVDHYQLTERAVKYALLFIGLTFMAFFLFETLTGLRVHPIQYLLVGAALVLFYLILLAFSEHLGFALAYLAASIACSGLIGFYLSAVLRGKLRGALFAASLLLLYGVLYLLLQSEDNALVLGAGLLFAILAGIMLLTRKLDWYQVADPARLTKETPAAEDEPRFRLWK